MTLNPNDLLEGYALDAFEHAAAANLPANTPRWITPPELHERLAIVAQAEGKSINAVAQEALQQRVAA